MIDRKWLLAGAALSILSMIPLAQRPARASDISVLSATYGGNCGIVGDNAGADLRKSCGGVDQCKYTVWTGRLGDPAYGCAKDYVAHYTCEGSPEARTAEAPAEAGRGRQITLDCSDVSSAAPAFTMKECEADSCGLWTFTGEEGEARWPKGQVASLKRQPWENGEVVVHRRDIRGMSRGLAAVYTGTRHGSRIEGQVTWTFPDGRQAQGNWSADIDDSSMEEVTARQKDADARHDSFEALRWLLAGAALGDATMQNDAGVAFIFGYGLPRDYAKARRLFLAAAEQGTAAAQINLGRIYEQGLGVARDPAQADAWYKKAGPQAMAAANVQREKARAAAEEERIAGAKQFQQLFEEWNRRRVAAEEACRQSEECRRQMDEDARREADDARQRDSETYLEEQRRRTQEQQNRQWDEYRSQHRY